MGDSVQVQEAVTAIREIVTEGGQVSGSQLSTLLKTRIPDWNAARFNVKNLRDFIAAHIADIIVSGRSGMDVLYSLKGAAPPLSEPRLLTPTSDLSFWRAWVSPNSPKILAVELASGTIQTVARGGAESSGQVRLRSPDASVHREIARDFLPEISSEEVRAKLNAALGSQSELWWQDWFRELRGTEYYAAWSSFRNRRLEELLVSQLRDANVSDLSISKVIKLVQDSRSVVPVHRRDSGNANSNADDATIRRVALAAVSRMSTGELRELRIPLGIVLDALASPKSR